MSNRETDDKLRERHKTAWLIERGQPEGLDAPEWWSRTGRYGTDVAYGWGRDAWQAVQYPSKGAAETAIARFDLPNHPFQARAVEHGFARPAVPEALDVEKAAIAAAARLEGEVSRLRTELDACSEAYAALAASATDEYAGEDDLLPEELVRVSDAERAALAASATERRFEVFEADDGDLAIRARPAVPEPLDERLLRATAFDLARSFPRGWFADMVEAEEAARGILLRYAALPSKEPTDDR